MLSVFVIITKVVNELVSEILDKKKPLEAASEVQD
jgi:hypothetical protein